MRLPLLKGRWLEASDTKTSDPVMGPSAEAARRYFQDRDPVGVTIEMSGTKGTVVGVVGSVRLRGPEVDFKPEIYLPSARLPGVMASRPLPHSLSGLTAIQAQQHDRERQRCDLVGLADAGDRRSEDPGRQAGHARRATPLQHGHPHDVRDHGHAHRHDWHLRRCTAFIVTQRTQEIGIRMALGAQAARVRWAILGDASRHLLIGLAIGLTTAAALAGSLETLLFQVHPRDAVVYAAASAVLMAAGLAAAFFPARRAALVDPVIALRVE